MKKFAQSLGSFLKNLVTNIIKNDDVAKASTLSFYTLTSIVPFFAVLFGIATTMGLERYLENELRETFKYNTEVFKYIVKFSHALLKDIKGGLIAVIGFITLLWTSFSLLWAIESTLDSILETSQTKSWIKRIIYFLLFLILCPLLFMVISSINVYIVSHLNPPASENLITEAIHPLIQLLLSLFPFLLNIALFSIIYSFLPSQPPSYSICILSGLFAGISFQLWQFIYFLFQEKISNYGVIYGAFAAIPLFLLWLQISWIIFLLGAEIASLLRKKSYLH